MTRNCIALLCLVQAAGTAGCIQHLGSVLEGADGTVLVERTFGQAFTPPEGGERALSKGVVLTVTSCNSDCWDHCAERFCPDDPTCVAGVTDSCVLSACPGGEAACVEACEGHARAQCGPEAGCAATCTADFCTSAQCAEAAPAFLVKLPAGHLRPCGQTAQDSRCPTWTTESISLAYVPSNQGWVPVEGLPLVPDALLLINLDRGSVQTHLGASFAQLVAGGEVELAAPDGEVRSVGAPGPHPSPVASALELRLLQGGVLVDPLRFASALDATSEGLGKLLAELGAYHRPRLTHVELYPEGSPEPFPSGPSYRVPADAKLDIVATAKAPSAACHMDGPVPHTCGVLPESELGAGWFEWKIEDEAGAVVRSGSSTVFSMPPGASLTDFHREESSGGNEGYVLTAGQAYSPAEPLGMTPNAAIDVAELAPGFTYTVAVTAYGPTGVCSDADTSTPLTCDPMTVTFFAGSDLDGARFFDAEGQRVDTVAPNVGTSVTHKSSEDVTYSVVEGPGTVVPSVVSPGGSATLTGTGEGVVVIRAALADGSYHYFAVEVAGDQACRFDASGQSGALCGTRPSHTLAAGDDPARLAPPVAARGVLLHNGAFKHRHTDLVVEGHSMDVRFERTHVSSRVPTSPSAAIADLGGVMGGWHFSWDQRLIPQGATAWLVPESAPDVADQTQRSITWQDGAGRMELFVPVSSEDVDFGTGADRFYVYDHQAQAASPRTFRARVTTYQSSFGVFATLRAYTLRSDPDDPEDPKDPHPYGGAGDRFYELSFPDGRRLVFDCRGKLTRVIDAQLHELTLVYEGPIHPLSRTRQLTALVDTAGRTYRVQWRSVAGLDRISRITDPFGRAIAFTYDSVGNAGQEVQVLSTVTEDLDVGDPEVPGVERRRGYSYDPQGRLTQLREPIASEAQPVATLTVGYDAQGRVDFQHLGDPEVVAPQVPDTVQSAGRYTFDWGALSVTDPRGTVRTYTLESVAAGQVTASVSFNELVWDDAGQASATDVVVAYSHDAHGLLTRLELPRRYESYWYDASGQWVRHERQPKGQGEIVTRVRELATIARGQVSCVVPVCETQPFYGTGEGVSCDADGLAHTGWQFAAMESGYELESAPGWMCKPTTIQMPEQSSGFDLTEQTTVELDWAPGAVGSGAPSLEGHQRGALLERRTRFGAVLPAPIVRTEVFTLAADGPATCDDAVLDTRPCVSRLGHPAGLRTTGPVPEACAGTADESVALLTTDARGNVIASTTEGVTRAMRYDAADRLVQETLDPEGLALVRTYSYTPRDLLQTISAPRADLFDEDDVLARQPPSPSSLGSGRRLTEHHYDRLGRRIATVVREGEGAGAEVVGEPVGLEIEGHDGLGYPVQRLVPGPGARAEHLAARAGLIGTSSMAALLALPEDNLLVDDGYVPRDAAFVRTEWERDARGRVLVERVSDGSAALSQGCPAGVSCAGAHALELTYGRDAHGNVVTAWDGRTDVQGIREAASYDAHDRLTRTEVRLEPGGEEPAEVLRRVEYSGYSPLGQPLGRTMSGCSALTEVPEPVLGLGCGDSEELASEAYTYDALGQLVTHREDRTATALLEPIARVHHYAYDHDGGVVREGTRKVLGSSSQDATWYGEVLRSYDHEGRLCGITAMNGAEWVEHGTWRRDVHGRVVEARRARAPSSFAPPTIGEDARASVTTFAYDRLGRVYERRQRVTAAEDEADLRTHIYYDSEGRVRRLVDPHGTVESLSYDGLGNLIEQRFAGARAADGDLAHWQTRTFSAGGRVLKALETRGRSAEGLEQVLSRTRWEHDVAGRAIRSYPFGDRPTPRVVDAIYNETGAEIYRRTLRDVALRSELDGLGHVRVITATPPEAWGVASKVQGRDARSRLLAVNALGQTIAAEERDGAGLAISRVEQTVDEWGQVGIEAQTHYAAVDGAAVLEAHKAVTRRYEGVLGGISGIVAPITGGQAAISLTYDAAGRLTAMAPSAGLLGGDFQAITYRHRGRLTAGRDVALPGLPVIQSELSIDRLGVHYAVTHGFLPAPDANPSDVVSLHHRRWWRGGKVVLDARFGAGSGVAPQRLGAVSSIGDSQLSASAAPHLTKAPSYYESYEEPGAIHSSWTGMRLDALGMPSEALTTTWNGGGTSSAVTLTRTLSERIGRRQVDVLTNAWDAKAFGSIGGQSYEARRVRFEYLDGLPYPDRVTHQALHEAATPHDPDALRGLLAAEGALEQSFVAMAGAHSELVQSDGVCEPGSGDCEDLLAPRYRYYYDAFDRLVYVEANEPGDPCDPSPQGGDRQLMGVSFVATGLEVAYDAFGRRVSAHYDSCGPSGLDGEKDRRFFYAGSRLVAEEFGSNAGKRETFYAWDGDGHLAAFFHQVLGSFDSATFFPLEDLDGGIVGIVDGQGGYHITTSEHGWFRAYPRLSGALEGQDVPFRRVAADVEVEGLGNLTWVDGTGYTVSVQQNRVTDGWYGRLAEEKAAVREALQPMVEVVGWVALALSPVPIVGDAADVVANGVSIGLDAYAQGASWSHLGEMLWVTGRAALSAAATLLGPAGAAGAASSRTARATLALSRLADASDLGQLGVGLVDYADGSSGSGPQLMGGGTLHNCFAAGTLVQTAEGARPIDELRAGDLVWGRDEATGALVWAPVVRTFETPHQALLSVELRGEGRAETLRVTPDHPIWVAERGWTEAKRLEPGDALVSLGGAWLRVGPGTWSVSSALERTTVYNIEVAGVHTYFVGELGAWVHNKSRRTTPRNKAPNATGPTRANPVGRVDSYNSNGRYNRDYNRGLDPRDKLNADHIPAAHLMEGIEGWTRGKGVTLNLPQRLHVEGRTYGSKVRALDDGGDLRAALARDIAHYRRLMMAEKDNYKLYRRYRKHLLEVIAENKRRFPEAFKKAPRSVR